MWFNVNWNGNWNLVTVKSQLTYTYMYICIYIHTYMKVVAHMVTEFCCNPNGRRSSSIIGMTPDAKRRNQTWWSFQFTTWLKSFTSPICNQILVDGSQTENEIHLKFCSAKDDLCVVELMNKSVLCSYLNFQRTKEFESKNCGSWLFQKP